MTWGTSAYGLSPWGGSAEVELSILGAHARSELSVRVVLSRGALAHSSAGVGDALNPRTWTVLRSDTLFQFVVLSVREVSAVIPGTVFELYLLQKLAPFGVEHVVKALPLVTPQGQRVATPRTFTFEGCQAAPTNAQAARATMVDLAKPQLSDGMGGAVFTVETSGDYGVEQGIPLLRKLFYRRITTTPGGFFHLTQYGLGVRLKAPYNAPQLIALKAEAERQLRLEPEVEAASVSVRLDTDGVLWISLAARLVSTGAEVRDTFPTVSL